MLALAVGAAVPPSRRPRGRDSRRGTGTRCPAPRPAPVRAPQRSLPPGAGGAAPAALASCCRPGGAGRCWKEEHGGGPSRWSVQGPAGCGPGWRRPPSGARRREGRGHSRPGSGAQRRPWCAVSAAGTARLCPRRESLCSGGRRHLVSGVSFSWLLCI